MLGLGLLVVLHESDFRGRDPEADELIADPAVGGKAAGFLDADRAEIGEDQLCRAGQIEGFSLAGQVGVGGRLAPDAEAVLDQLVELVARLIVIVGIDQPQINRRMAPVGNDGKQNVVAGLGRTFALFNGLDAGLEDLLIELKVVGRLGGDDLPFARRDGGNFHILLQILRQHDIGKAAEHGDQFRHIDEGREPRDGLVFTRGLQFEFGRHIAESRGPGVELVQAAFLERVEAEEPLNRKHFAQRIGDRRT